MPYVTQNDKPAFYAFKNLIVAFFALKTHNFDCSIIEKHISSLTLHNINALSRLHCQLGPYVFAAQEFEAAQKLGKAK